MRPDATSVCFFHDNGTVSSGRRRTSVDDDDDDAGISTGSHESNPRRTHPPRQGSTRGAQWRLDAATGTTTPADGIRRTRAMEVAQGATGRPSARPNGRGAPSSEARSLRSAARPPGRVTPHAPSVTATGPHGVRHGRWKVDLGWLRSSWPWWWWRRREFFIVDCGLFPHLRGSSAGAVAPTATTVPCVARQPAAAGIAAASRMGRVWPTATAAAAACTRDGLRSRESRRRQRSTAVDESPTVGLGSRRPAARARIRHHTKATPRRRVELSRINDLGTSGARVRLSTLVHAK